MPRKRQVPTLDDVRRIGLALPETGEEQDRFALFVRSGQKKKAFVWTWNERPAEGGAREPRPDVLAVRVAGEDAKQMLIAAEPDKFFTEPHYNGFPAVLVRLAAFGDLAELEELVIDAWRVQAPRKLARAWVGPASTMPAVP